MNEIKNLKTVVNVSIPFIKPNNLEKLAKNFQNTSNFPDMQSSFEFPPKPIQTVIKLLSNKKYEALNFFDIARLLTQLKNDKLSDFTSGRLNKYTFANSIQELFNKYKTKKYIQNAILKVTTQILMSKKENTFKEALEYSLTSKEFIFIQYCIKKDFKSIQKQINNKNFSDELRKYGIHKILSNHIILYSDMLLMQLYSINITDNTINCYKNNLLLENNLSDLYKKTDKLLILIAKNNSQNVNYLDDILVNKLGNIEDNDSNWHKLAIPLNLQEKYKRLKGLFEFQRFVDIAKYLSKYTNLKNSNLSKSGKTSDSTRILSRSDFWSNYDERFSSVKMWVSEDDYRVMLIDKPVELNGIKQLKNIENEACMLEFKEKDLLIIEFFRQRDSGISRKSLIFEDIYVYKVKNILTQYDFTNSLYDKLKKLSSFRIHHDFLWQGWVDKFLTDRGIYPNESILNGKKFQSHKKVIYKKGVGLESARTEALKNERVIRYQDIISKH